MPMYPYPQPPPPPLPYPISSKNIQQHSFDVNLNAPNLSKGNLQGESNSASCSVSVSTEVVEEKDAIIDIEKNNDIDNNSLIQSCTPDEEIKKEETKLVQTCEKARVKEKKQLADGAGIIQGTDGSNTYGTKSSSKKKKKQAAKVKSEVSNAPTHGMVGLGNNTGENNCFLNVVVQALYHFNVLEKLFAHGNKNSHQCNNTDGCLLCELEKLYHLLCHQEDNVSVISTESLRTVVNNCLTNSENCFSNGSMDDAVETHDALLNALHGLFISNVEETKKKECVCAIHDAFGINVCERVDCSVCCNSSTNVLMRYDTFFVYASTRLLFDVHEKTTTFSEMLHIALNSDKNCCLNPACTGSTGSTPQQVLLELSKMPDFFSVGLSWYTDQPKKQLLTQFWQHCISPNVDLNIVFQKSDSQSKNADLVGLYCFYSHHYTVFIYDSKRTYHWFLLDDLVVKDVGSTWQHVVDFCIQQHFQPMALFYKVNDEISSKDGGKELELGMMQFQIGEIIISLDDKNAVDVISRSNSDQNQSSSSNSSDNISRDLNRHDAGITSSTQSVNGKSKRKKNRKINNLRK